MDTMTGKKYIFVVLMTMFLISFVNAEIVFNYGVKNPYAVFDYSLSSEEQQKILSIEGTYDLEVLFYGDTIVYIEEKFFTEQLQKDFKELDEIFSSPVYDISGEEKDLFGWINDLFIQLSDFIIQQEVKNLQQEAFNKMVCEHPDFKTNPICILGGLG